MPIARRTRTAITSSNKPVYMTSFVRRTHEILKMGYDRLDAPRYSKHEEEDITGELVRSIQNTLQDRTAPRWAKNFWVIDEARVYDCKRLGKRRLRIDIEIIKSQQGPRPRFRFEAKRLRDSASRRAYLGSDGLGCFLDGRYAKEDEIVGMLGYVQEDSIDAHATALERTFVDNRQRYATRDEKQWLDAGLVKRLTTYRTTHNRADGISPIVVLHTFLSFVDDS